MATQYTPLYPGAVQSFSERSDGVNVVSAVDVNQLYGEVNKLETYVGTNPHSRPSGNPWGTGSFNTSSSTFVSASERLLNVENGTYIVYNDYVSKSGGTTIQPSGPSVVGLTFAPASSGNPDLLYAEGSVVTKITSTGKFWTTAIDGGTP
jgi:hypothetical protein